MNLSVSFSPILWSSQTGDHAQEYFTKFGSRPDMKIKEKEFVKWNAKLIIIWLKDCENKCEIKILVYKSGHKFLQPAISICFLAVKVASSSSCSNSSNSLRNPSLLLLLQVNSSSSTATWMMLHWAYKFLLLHRPAIKGSVSSCNSPDHQQHKQHEQRNQQLYINSHKSCSFLIIYDPCAMLICCSNKIVTRIHHHPCGQTNFPSWCNFQHCQITCYSSIDYFIAPSKPDEGMFMNSWTFGIFLLVVYFVFVFFSNKKIPVSCSFSSYSASSTLSCSAV